jgi:signal transduction histidine kinase
LFAKNHFLPAMVYEKDRSGKSHSGWSGYLEWKALRAHIIMAWCGVFLFPAFGLLDYLVIDNWELFLTVRLSFTVLLFVFMVIARRLGAGSSVVGHAACLLIMIPLMWMLSRVETTEQFFIYSLNISTAYIASAIFLLWHYKHSIFLAVGTVVAFAFFSVAFSTLSFGQIMANGTLPLATLVIMSQIFVHHRYKSVYHDFIIQSELNDANFKLQAKNHEIETQHKEIVLQNGKLEDLNELKDRLLMIISHDFRSPLQSLKGLILLINDSDRITPEEFRTMVKGLKYKVDKTYDFLEGLLIWSKSQMRGFQVKPQRLILHTLAEDCIHLLQSFSEKKGITLTNKVDSNHIAFGDEDMIRLVIRNLTANAIKFTPSGGSIKISSEEIERHIRISVADNGVGMDQVELERLFSSTTFFNKQGTNMERGTGLGLMLCRDFVEKNHGRISVHSVAGEGTTIAFTVSKNRIDGTVVDEDVQHFKEKLISE